jgi:hypothetical protein
MSMPATLRTILAVAIITGLLLPAGALAMPPDARADGDQAPWLGTWQLNPARSTQRSDPSPYRRVAFRIESAGNGLKVTYRMVGTRGGITRMEWTGEFDGQDYAVQGSDNVMTNAYRRIDDRAYEIVVKVDGQQAAVATVSVSPDGRTLTVATAERHPRGQIVTTTAVYEKQ